MDVVMEPAAILKEGENAAVRITNPNRHSTHPRNALD
jgi:hypothetical protein